MIILNMKTHRVAYALLVYAVLILYIQMTWSGGTNKSVQFAQVVPQNCGPLRLASPWSDKSRLSCAANCLTRFSNCTGFIYNIKTGHCTPTSGLSAGQPLPAIDEENYFVNDSYETFSHPNFTIKSNGPTKANVAYFYDPPLNYADARAACERLDAHLFVAYTVEKYGLVRSIINITHKVYIGLDDIAVEGKFVWADSGQEINSSLRAAIFHPGQPDNWAGSEDCAVINPYDTDVNDDPCSGLNAYICERPLC